MARTLAQIRGDVQTYLGDTAAAIWSTSELDSYIKEGYDDLCFKTGLLWIKASPAGIQPTISTGTYTLPTDLYRIERMTWRRKRLMPLSPEEAAARDPRYRVTEGQITGYIVEGDGVGTIRYFKVPAVTDTEISIEYQRRGAVLSSGAVAVEIPDRYADYLTWFAMGRALERDGIGQDMQLSQLFKDRYSEGLIRIKRRKSAAVSSRAGSLGGGERPCEPPLPRFPWNYGA